MENIKVILYLGKKKKQYKGPFDLIVHSTYITNKKDIYVVRYSEFRIDTNTFYVYTDKVL